MEVNNTSAVAITHHFLKKMVPTMFWGRKSPRPYDSGVVQHFFLFFAFYLVSHFCSVPHFYSMSHCKPPSQDHHRSSSPQLAKKLPGCLVFTSSAAAMLPGPFSVLYAATKSFLSAFGASLAGEVKPHGIDVCVVHPSPVATRCGAGWC